MGIREPRVDAYIEKSAPFARPILTHIREVVHEACPEVEEAIKWSFPTFSHHGMLASMASFKVHCSFGFWRAAEVLGDDAPAVQGEREAGMGQFGRLTSVADLPSRRELTKLIRRAAKLNEERARTGRQRPATGRSATNSVERGTRGVKGVDGVPSAARAPVVAPDDLATALAANPTARATFERFSPSHRREYVEWITEAKRDETRRKRVATAVEWMSEGKPRNWKYIK